MCQIIFLKFEADRQTDSVVEDATVSRGVRLKVVITVEFINVHELNN